MSPICAVTACTSPIAFCTAANWSMTRLKLSFICFSTAAWSCSFTVFWISASLVSLPSRISRSFASIIPRVVSNCAPICSVDLRCASASASRNSPCSRDSTVRICSIAMSYAPRNPMMRSAVPVSAARRAARVVSASARVPASDCSASKRNVAERACLARYQEQGSKRRTQRRGSSVPIEGQTCVAAPDSSVPIMRCRGEGPSGSPGAGRPRYRSRPVSWRRFTNDLDLDDHDHYDQPQERPMVCVIVLSPSERRPGRSRPAFCISAQGD